MGWDGCFCISAIWMLAGFALFLARRRVRTHDEQKNTLRKTSIVPWSMILLAMAAFTGFLPICAKEVGDAAFRLLRVALLSLYSTVQVFSANTDSGMIREYFGQNPQGFENFCSLYMTFLLVVCPVVMAGYIISLFSHLFAHVRYRCYPFRDVYIFSELNERSLTFGENLYESFQQNGKKAMIVFANAFGSGGSERKELRERADKIRAICLKEGVSSFNFERMHQLKAKLRFIVIGEDDESNLRHAMSIEEIYGSRAERYYESHKTKDSDEAYNTWIYVFTTSAESGLLFSDSKDSAVVVRRVNEVSALINRTLYEEGYELFKKADTYSLTASKQISVVIVGLGSYGTEMLKALAWFCQMDGYTLLINAYDRDPLAEEKFAAQCSELLSSKYVYTREEDGEAQYEIHIHSGIDADTKAFADEIGKLGNVTYAFVALDSDSENIKTVINLRMLFGRRDPRVNPVIHAVVRSVERKNALEKWIAGESKSKNEKDRKEPEIKFIGDMRSIYTEEVIIGSALEKDAERNIHQEYAKALSEAEIYDKKKEFWAVEYNYASSVASAIHQRTVKKLEELGQKSDDSARQEHRRWNAYMRSKGYIYRESRKGEANRDNVAKTHKDLVPYAQLSKEEQEKDRFANNPKSQSDIK